MDKKSLIYKRIGLFLLGFIVALTLCFIVWCSFSKNDSESKETQFLELFDHQYLSRQRNHNHLIPDSVIQRNTWRKIISGKIANFCLNGDGIYWMESENYLTFNENDRVEDADPQTFCVDSEGHYAKDKNHVYWVSFIKRLPVYFYDEVEKSALAKTVKTNPIEIIWNADSKTFVSLGDGFAADKNRMYFEGEEIDWDNELFDPKICNQVLKLWMDFTAKCICN